MKTPQSFVRWPLASASFVTRYFAALALFVISGRAQEATIRIHADDVQHPVSRMLTGACIEDVNHELYGGIDSQMIYGESFAEPAPKNAGPTELVSGMWRTIQQGSAVPRFSIETMTPFSGEQSQVIEFVSGTGEIGVENESLNRWGMYFEKGKKYEGYIWARSLSAVDIFVALQASSIGTTLCEERLHLNASSWKRLNFALTPNATTTNGGFVIKLKQPGGITLGYALLQPGPWGRFKNLPVRKDVAEGLIGQGITVLRLGGSMVNAPEYRWKKMVGPRDRRPPYKGTWHPQSSDGWGIFEFLSFCEEAGFAAVPAINADESPQDMAEFIDYANGSTAIGWGLKRVEDGHPKPYRLKYLEIGNEERVNDDYFRKFKPMAEAIWAHDPSIILVVGDFAYNQPIIDPFNFSGADSHITTLAAQQKILQLAKQHDREVWFDVHVNTEGPRPNFGGTFSYIDALDKIADGAKHRVVIFEFNAGNHSQRRALANAAAINAVERDGRLPIATSANCLQPDGQNDNDWDQGLLFLNNSRVWLQPPGYVTQMISRNYESLLVKSEVAGAQNDLDVTAKRSEDGKHLVLQVVNFSDQPIATALSISGFKASEPVEKIETLAGPLDARNTADDPDQIKPSVTQQKIVLRDGQMTHSFPGHSFTTISLH
ncbi:MAG TPA: alpha-L-arabinofuranosidase C-terminal domain-containing protein [Verrucomicrobiae bacterium]|jgi:hypothetical protein